MQIRLQANLAVHWGWLLRYYPVASSQVTPEWVSERYLSWLKSFKVKRTRFVLQIKFEHQPGVLRDKSRWPSDLEQSKARPRTPNSYRRSLLLQLIKHDQRRLEPCSPSLRRFFGGFKTRSIKYQTTIRKDTRASTIVRQGLMDFPRLIREIVQFTSFGAAGKQKDRV